MNRPLVWIAVPFVGGLLVGASDLPGVVPGAAVAGFCGAVALVLSGPSERLVRLGCVLIFASGGALYWNARHPQEPVDELLRQAIQAPEAMVEIEGAVERPDIFLPQLGYGQFTLRAARYRHLGTDEWRPVDSGVLIRWNEPALAVFTNDTVRVSGRLEHALSTLNPDVSSYEDYLRRRDIDTALRLHAGSHIEQIAPGSDWSPFYWASRFRYAQASRLVEVIPENVVPFVLTVWLGERRLFDNTTYRTYVESGTAHILAVSGVHTGIVYLSAEFLLLLMLRDYRYRRIRRILGLTVVVIFALVAGARVSSLRAMTMIALYVLAQLFDRDPDAPTALSLAAILFTMHDPDLLFDPGFILSFSAIASLLIFREPILELFAAWPRAIREGLAASLAVQIVPLPAAAAIFSIVPILGTLANLVVVPLLTVALWLTLMTSLLSFVWMSAAEIVGYALYPVVGAIDGIATRVAGVSGSYIEVSQPTAWALAAYGAGAFGLYKAVSAETYRVRWAGAGLAAFVVAAMVWSLRPPADEVVFLDVGQGDATVVRTSAGAVLVIDAGDRIGSVDYGERSVAAYLRSQGLTRIDALVGTHGDKDHQGGLEYLVRHFDVGTLYLTHIDTGDPIESTLTVLCRSRSIPLRRIAAGYPLTLEGADIHVLHPPKDWGPAIADNERSIVLLAELQGERFLLTGDIESGAESRLAALDIAAPVLKVPHHGSRTSSSTAFLEAVRPGYAVVSTGRQGRKRILSQAVLDHYIARGVTVLRTDFSGGIRFRFDEEWTVETARGMRGYPHPTESGPEKSNPG